MKAVKTIGASLFFLVTSMSAISPVIDREAYAQGGLTEKLIKKLDWSNASEAKSAYNRLLAKGEKAVPYLIASLSNPFENTSIRANCADILGKLKAKKAIPSLIDALDLHNKFRVRYTAAIALGRIGDNSAIPALTKALDDPDMTVKYHVISAIKKIDDKSAGPALIKMLGDVNPEIRLLTAEVLVYFGTKEAGPAFISILRNRWDIKEIRVLAATGTGNIGGKDAIEALSDSLISDPDNTVRAECAVSLGKLGDKNAVPHLIKALSDEYKNVSLSAGSSLSQITGKQLGFDADRWLDWYKKNSS